MTHRSHNFKDTFGNPIADSLALDGESKSDFNNLLDTNLRDYQPKTFTEAMHIQDLTICEWRQIRNWSISDYLLAEIAKAPNPKTEMTQSAKALECLLTEDKYLNGWHNRLLKGAATIGPKN